MTYKRENYIRENGDVMCPECHRYIIPGVQFEKETVIIFFQCGKCLDNFKIKVKIIDMERYK